MARCRSTWRFQGEVAVGVTADGPAGQFYSLVYVLYRNDDSLPLVPGASFKAAELRAGVTWKVPDGYRCEFELTTTGSAAIETKITLNQEPAECNPGRHCQGPCAPTGSAGLAGSWAVTGTRTA